MATFSRREHIEKTIEYFVPSPSTWVEVDKTAGAAWREFVAMYARNPSDDELMVRPGDDGIVISFRGRGES